jgi:hypothetical protein
MKKIFKSIILILVICSSNCLFSSQAKNKEDKYVHEVKQFLIKNSYLTKNDIRFQHVNEKEKKLRDLVSDPKKLEVLKKLLNDDNLKPKIVSLIAWILVQIYFDGLGVEKNMKLYKYYQSQIGMSSNWKKSEKEIEELYQLNNPFIKTTSDF